MPTSYDGTLLDHLAKHIMYLSAASSFWCSLNSSYDHDNHLSKWLGMSPQDYEHLLAAADLAHVHQKRGFCIKISKWKLFLKGHLFKTTICMGTMEVDTKKLDLHACVNGVSPKNRQQVYFIRIGGIAVNSPRQIEMQKDSDGWMIVTPPRLNGLWIKLQAFTQNPATNMISTSCWNWPHWNPWPWTRRCACRRSGIPMRGSAPSSYSHAISSSSMVISVTTTRLFVILAGAVFYGTVTFWKKTRVLKYW